MIRELYYSQRSRAPWFTSFRSLMILWNGYSCMTDSKGASEIFAGNGGVPIRVNWRRIKQDPTYAFAIFCLLFQSIDNRKDVTGMIRMERKAVRATCTYAWIIYCSCMNLYGVVFVWLLLSYGRVWWCRTFKACLSKIIASTVVGFVIMSLVMLPSLLSPLWYHPPSSSCSLPVMSIDLPPLLTWSNHFKLPL